MSDVNDTIFANKNESNIRILAVDDEPISRFVIQTMLQDTNFAFDIVSEGDDAIEKAKSGEYSVVISDLNMPRTDGYEVVKNIKKYANENNKNIKVFALTASDAAEIREKCKAAGFDGVIIKGCSKEEVLNVIFN